jgi:hypothetical protein
MQEQTANALIVGFISLFGAGVGAYLGAYLKKKGENLATQEDIDKIVDQVRIVTETTKEIEAKISTEMWNRQKLWEMKRDVVFQTMSNVAKADNALLSYAMLLKVQPGDGPSWAEIVHDRTLKWSQAANALDEVRLHVSVVCAEETTRALDDFAMLVSQIAAKISAKETDAYDNSSKALAQAAFKVKAALRKELGVDPESI